MGSPEYPSEDNQRASSFTPPPSHILPMHGQPESAEDSDDAEEQTGGVLGEEYAGYQPLNQLENMSVCDDDDDDDVNDDDEAMEATTSSSSNNQPLSTSRPTEAEREMFKDVWNAPRPAELDIHLDDKKAEEIKSVMSNIQLAFVKPPAWSLDIPESKWVEDLLQEVRNKQKSGTATNCTKPFT